MQRFSNINLPIVLRSLLPFLLLLICFQMGASQAHAQGDRQVVHPSLYEPEAAYKKIELTSFYLTMRDSVQIAVDLLLPKGLEPGTKVPTILHLTRYWRGLDLRWPFKGVYDKGPPSLSIFASTEAMVKQGYAMVSVDVRGSGASGGTRIMELGPRELADGQEILDWIVAQPWSNGNVGAVGISYNGWTAGMLATLRHPALKAIIPMHAFFDGYQEMTFVGGVPHEALAKSWSNVCASLDQNRLSGRVPGAKLALRGYSLVEPKKRKDQWEALSEAHAQNHYAEELAGLLEYRDDTIAGLPNVSIDSVFPCGHIDDINSLPVAVYSMSGWYDISGAASATRQFLNYSYPGNKLLLAAWNHGGRRSCSPFAPSAIEFSRLSEILKFFDFHLKGIDNGLEREARVHYFHMGAEEWRTADHWPPKAVVMESHYLGADQQMQTTAPSEAAAHDPLLLDTTTYAGKSTRWELSGRNRADYDTLLQQVPGLLSYAGPEVREDMDITGIPEVNLFLASEGPDGTCFAYLLDESPEGEQHVMSQGHLRLSCRQEILEGAPYQDVVPYRSFARADAMDMPQGEVEEVHFALSPVSWRLKKGHRVRLVLCGSDRSHFALVTPGPVQTQLHRSAAYPSQLKLPVMPSAQESAGPVQDQDAD